MIKKSLALTLLFLLFINCFVLAEEAGEETQEVHESLWNPITENLLVYNNKGDNHYLLKSGKRGLLFGASDPTIVDHLVEAGIEELSYIFLWNTRRDQIMGLREIIRGCEIKFGSKPKVGAPDSQRSLGSNPENFLLENNRDYWSLKVWRSVSGSIDVNPADIPLFQVKPAFLFRKREGERYLTANWGGYKITFMQMGIPHSSATAFIFEVDRKRMAVTGRMMLNEGRIRKLTDFWSGTKFDSGKVNEELKKAVSLVLGEKIDLVLPEIGDPMTPKQTVDSLGILTVNLEELSKLIPIQIRMDYDPYPGVYRIDLERDAYLINGGDGHYMLVNPGYPPALEKIPEFVGEDGKIDLIFSTDCKDLHNVCGPSLAEKYNSRVLSCASAARLLSHPENYLFPNNSTRSIQTRVIKEDDYVEWRGAKLYFKELPGFSIGQQVMLMETTGARVLFIGDALVNLRMFPFYSPYLSPDLRKSTFEKVIKIIEDFKPTYIVDDWGVREVRENFKYNTALTWFDKYIETVNKLVLTENKERAIDPFWIRSTPDALEAEWGKNISTEIIVRNFSDKKVKMELSLCGEYLKGGYDWKQEIEIEASSVARVPVTFSVSEACSELGTAIGILVRENGVQTCPSQIIVMQKKVISNE